ncbi:unnamed protein product [Mucor fragilis]
MKMLRDISKVSQQKQRIPELNISKYSRGSLTRVVPRRPRERQEKSDVGGSMVPLFFLPSTNALNSLRQLSLNGLFLLRVSFSPPPPSPLSSPQQEYSITNTVWKQALEEPKANYNTLPAVSMTKQDQARVTDMTKELIAGHLTTSSMKPLYRYAKIVEDILKTLHNKDVKKMKEDVF